MSSPIDEIPSGLKPLFERCGPVLRYRFLRDVLGRDESYLQTAHVALDLPRLPEAESLMDGQELDGSWNGIIGDGETPGTAYAILRLCELGLEQCGAVQTCVERMLFPTLLNDEILWEFEDKASDGLARKIARQIVRDKMLRLICRIRNTETSLIRPFLQIVMTEWKHCLDMQKHGDLEPDSPLPTFDAYAAVCWFPWEEDEFPAVRKAVVDLVKHAEAVMGKDRLVHPLHAPHAFRLLDKWEYLSEPPQMFHDLELSARLGVTRSLPVSNWLLDELEIRQDADGTFRFDISEPLEPTWYFPLEKTRPDEYDDEFSVRGLMIYKLLEYDI